METQNYTILLDALTWEGIACTNDVDVVVLAFVLYRALFVNFVSLHVGELFESLVRFFIRLLKFSQQS